MASRGYSRIRKIGEGSFGKAWLVRGRDGREYIMKTIDIRRMNKKQQKEARNEVKVLSSLKHPYVVCYRDSFFEESNGLCIIMDYAEGGDLSARIRKARDFGKGFTEPQILRWFSQAALALKYMHEKHILHRDLKTQNLFLTRTDRLRLGDFGISKILDSTLAFAETTIGTPYYLSPEICEERPYNWASDIWALGCILYEMCCLKVPFDATNIKALVDKITKGPTPELPKHYSPELRQLLRDCLNRDWTRRPTAAEIVGRGIVQGEIRRMLEEEEEEDGSPRSWYRGCSSRSPRCCPSPVPMPRSNHSPKGPQRYSQMEDPRALPRGCPPPPSPVPNYSEFSEQRSPAAGMTRQNVQQPRSPVLDDRRSPVGRVAPDDSPRSVASCHRDVRYAREGSPGRGVPYCSPTQQRQVVGKRRRVGTSASPAHIPRHQSPRSPVVQGVPVPMAHPRGGQQLVVQGVLLPSNQRGQPHPSQVPDSSPAHKGSHQHHHGLPPVWSQPNYRKYPHGVSRSVDVENRGPNVGAHRGGGAPMNAGGILASPMKMGALARKKLQQSPAPNGRADDFPRSCYDVRSSVMSEGGGGGRSPYPPQHRRY
ncbi:hypothetical protein FOL47_008914 [Perkinsus chesapeaki]|uniref:non-specific serine/threonine protein kinase n=1 Tax=Perkinsus chesapeaki TaxID=330153 RepID=A0A7J6LB51_PERCH|nr:hypothetical protein FOL47_008914 [Perkinsus chesapeaki]